MSGTLDGTRFHGVGVVNNLCLAWTKANGSPADMQTLIEDPVLLADIIQICRGKSDDYVYKIDCDTEPKLPWEGSKLVLHRGRGQLKWDKSLVRLIGVSQEYGEAQARKGVLLRQVIEDHGGHAANARFAEFLRLHPGLVPPEWRQFKRIFFLNSRFEVTGWSAQGKTDMVVRTLESEMGDMGRRWSLYMEKIDAYLGRDDAIAVLGKNS